VLARFLAFVRTFAPTVAGAARMPYHKFAIYNIAGGTAWVFSMCLLGYFVGSAVPNVEVVFLGIVGLMFLFSIAPAAWHLLRQRRRARAQPAES
jgi:membrane-associated protein